MWWPFHSKLKLTPEQRERAKRKCGLAVRTLQNCWRANPASPAKCSSLETHVVFCHAEVVCPALAAEYEACFKRVVASKGAEALTACDKQAEAMRKCLRHAGLFPFPPA